MKGIFPWETLPGSYFTGNISWEFTCRDRSTDNPETLAEFWLPDQHDLRIRTIIKFDAWDEKMHRVLSPATNPKWVLSWRSTGTNLCGSSDLVTHHPEYVDIICIVPMGSCLKSLVLEPVAISTGVLAGKDGIFSPPPGAVLTLIQPLIITLGEAPAFPLYEKYGDGNELIKWSVPDNLSENLNEDISRLIAVEVDMNHELIKNYPGEIEMAARQKKGLLYQIIISDYLRIICSDEQIVNAVEEADFEPETAGASIKWLLTEIADQSNFSKISDLCLFLRKKPAELFKIVDKVFSSVLLK